MAGKPAGATAFQLAYQISPIILTGGVASAIPGGMLPIISITQAVDFAEGLLGTSELDLDNFLFQFHPLAGSTLVEQEVGRYPFANQQVAANATIRQPLHLSMLMIVSAKPFVGGYATKSMAIAALKASLDQHNNSGGMYSVATPAFIYTNGLLRNVRDISSQVSKQPQNAYQWDFEFPLITLQQALQAQAQMNSNMAQISAGVPTDGATSGFQATVGSPPSLATPSIAPAASNLVGSNTTAIGPIPVSASSGPGSAI